MFKRFHLSKNDIYTDEDKGVNYNTKYILDQIGLDPDVIYTDSFRKMIGIIDEYQLQTQGDWFGNASSQKEAQYIIAFLAGKKDFMLKNKCVYNQIDDSSKLTYYQLMSNLVKKNINNESVMSSDPCPEINTDVVRASCNQSMSIENYEPRKQHQYNCLIKVCIATLLFLILSNQQTYEFTNKFISTLTSSCPSEVGNMIHALVFFILFYALMRLVK
jgi:hypothetical protein